MAAEQVPKKGQQDLYECLNKDDIVSVCCTSKSKRRRVRRKNKITASVICTGEDQNTIVESDYSQKNKQILNYETANRDLLRNNCSLAEKADFSIENLSEMESNEGNMETKNKSSKIAQRQDKKQAKLAAKTKSKIKIENNQKKNENCQQITKEEKLKSEKQVEKLKSDFKDVKEPLEVKCIEDGKHAETASDENKVKQTDETVEKFKEVNVCKTNSGESNLRIEKSREEIKAEREARKLAKLNAKCKSKVNKGDVLSESTSGEKSPKVTEKKETNSEQGQIIIEKKLNEQIMSESTQKDVQEKSKAELRAERRAKQEAQRAAKEAEKRLKLGQNECEPTSKEKKIEVLAEIKQNKEKVVTLTPKVGHQRVKLFSHLKFEKKTSEVSLINIHPEIVQLGIKYSSRIIMGSNARCVAFLRVLKEVIMDFITPSEKEFTRALESHLSTVMVYLNKCRPSSVSMINALRHIKSHLTQLSNDISDIEARRKLCDVIDVFIREQIEVAGEAICNAVQKKIANRDNILIYACSSLLYRILVESHKSGKQFTVVVVDSGPWFEGREMLRRLIDHGIKCSYVLVSALTFIMRDVTKVLLGAHALLANGSVMSRAGSALVALVANSHNVPVLVCCETYKFCERVQMDAFVYNELGNDEDMEYCKSADTKENESALATLSVLYDITPADLVTAVVTELAILPCTSVPVILRIKPSDIVT